MLHCTFLNYSEKLKTSRDTPPTGLVSSCLLVVIFSVCLIIIIRRRIRIRINLGGGGQQHLLKLYTAELEQNVGTFLAFLWTSNWYEWY